MTDCIFRLYFPKMPATFSFIAYALSAQPHYEVEFVSPTLLNLGGPCEWTDRIWQECRSDAVPILDDTLAGLTVLPSFLLKVLGTPPLGTQPPCCKKTKPHGEAMCKRTSQQSQISSQPTSSINCQPREWAIFNVQSS